MPTNMTQPWEQRFDTIMATWWQEINQILPMPMNLSSGTARPLRDWLTQPDQDHCWFYPLDDRDEPEWRALFQAAHLLPTIESVHVTTALYITSQLSEDLLHELEIPGVWIVRVQKRCQTP